MKKIACALCFMFLFFSLALQAKENSFPSPRPPQKRLPNRLYFGIDLINLQVNVKNVDENQITGNNFLKGVRLGYDVIKPNSPYVGFHLFSTLNQAQFNFEPDLSNYYVPSEDKMGRRARAPFQNIEFRLGQTFAGLEGLSTLFVGLGAYGLLFPRRKDNYGSSTSYSQLISYLTGGVLTSYSFGPSLDAGLHFKLFWMLWSLRNFHYKLVGKMSYTDTICEREKGWGLEVSFPLTWYPTRMGELDVQLEPYYLRLGKKGIVKGYGVRLLFGYHF